MHRNRQSGTCAVRHVHEQAVKHRNMHACADVCGHAQTVMYMSTDQAGMHLKVTVMHIGIHKCTGACSRTNELAVMHKSMLYCT